MNLLSNAANKKMRYEMRDYSDTCFRLEPDDFKLVACPSDSLAEAVNI